MLLKENTFTRRKFTKVYVANLIGWMISLAAEMLDTFAAGTYINADAVAGIELATPIEYIFYAVAILFTYSTGVLYTRALGHNDHEKSKQIAGMGLIVSAITGIIMLAIIYFSAEWFVGLYNCSDEIKAYAVTFIQRKFLMVPIYFVYNCLYQLVVYDGDELTILLADAELVIACIYFPFVFAKNYGFEGLSLSYLAVYALGTLVVLTHFLKKRNSISFKAYFNLKELGEIVKLSSPYAMTSIYIAIVDIVFNAVIVNKYGDEALSAYAVVNIIVNYAEVLTAAMTGGQIFVGIAYGERCFGSIKRTMKLVLKNAIILSIALSAVLIAIAPYWPDILAIEDPVIAEYAVFAGRVTPTTYIFAAFIYTFITYYPMVEKTIYGNLISAAYMLFGPFAICLPITSRMSFNAMTVGFTLTPVFALLFMVVVFVLSKKTKNMPLFVPENDETEYYYDLELSKENIVYLRNKMIAEISKENIDNNLLNEMATAIEDSLVYILNANKKKVIAEVSLMINKEHLRIIIKDNGEILDLTKDMEDAKTLGSYTVDCLSNESYEKANDIAISFNRNLLSWNL